MFEEVALKNMCTVSLAKWGLTTPRVGLVNASNAYVTFGDLNMAGFPCSQSCNGSQAGRGGSFFSLMHPRLHTSLVRTVISGACRCSSPAVSRRDLDKLLHTPVLDNSGLSTFEELRMCHRGCVKKIEEHLEPIELPTLSLNASSFWTK